MWCGERERRVSSTRGRTMTGLLRKILEKVSVVPDGRRESHLLARFNSQVLGISRRQTYYQWFETSDKVLPCAERSVGLLFNHVDRATAVRRGAPTSQNLPGLERKGAQGWKNKAPLNRRRTNN
ncbi:unnamed protein product [Ectocarpus sp. 8 AP-2014]